MERNTMIQLKDKAMDQGKGGEKTAWRWIEVNV